MNSGMVEASWNVPFTPSPIDFGRRRQPATVIIKRLQSTLPVKHKLTCNTQLFIVHPPKDTVLVSLHK